MYQSCGASFDWDLNEIHRNRAGFKVFTGHVVIYASRRYKLFEEAKTISNFIDDEYHN